MSLLPCTRAKYDSETWYFVSLQNYCYWLKEYPLREESCLVPLHSRLLVGLKKVWMVGLWLDPWYFAGRRENEGRCSELLHGWRTSYHSFIFHNKKTNSCWMSCRVFKWNCYLQEVSLCVSLMKGKVNRWCGWKCSQGDVFWEQSFFQQAAIT